MNTKLLTSLKKLKNINKLKMEKIKSVQKFQDFMKYSSHKTVLKFNIFEYLKLSFKRIFNLNYQIKRNYS